MVKNHIHHIYVCVLCFNFASEFLGLSGFDSGQEWYVSKQCAVRRHYKTTVNNYLAITTLLLLLDRIIVDLLNPGTRYWDETSPGSSCSEARRYGGAAKSGIASDGLASLVKI